jgi:hypothetical protein
VIVVTPFTDTYELDEASLRKEVRFCIETGAALLARMCRALPQVKYIKEHKRHEIHYQS